MSPNSQGSRTKYIHSVFAESNSFVPLEKIQESWNALGNTSEISISLYRYAKRKYKQKYQLAQLKERRISSTAKRMEQVAIVRRNTALVQSYMGMERSLDELVYKAMEMSEPGLVEEFRTVRRSIMRRIIEIESE